MTIFKYELAVTDREEQSKVHLNNVLSVSLFQGDPIYICLLNSYSSPEMTHIPHFALLSL